MTRKLTLLLTLMVTLALLAACGGGDSTDSGGDSGSDSGGEAAPEEPTEVEYTAEMIADGETLYGTLCIACHGPDATGIEGLGKDLTTSEFLAERSDTEMLEFVQTGRPSSDPLNTTGIDMPPRGGNPALKDEEILHIIAYLRSLQQ